MTGSDPLLRFRPEFPIVQNTTYLISNSLGAMPRAEVWWDMSISVGDEVAPLLGAAPGTVTMLPSVTYTTDEELDRAFEAIDEIRASGAWERWRDRPALIT